MVNRNKLREQKWSPGTNLKKLNNQNLEKPHKTKLKYEIDHNITITSNQYIFNSKKDKHYRQTKNKDNRN